MLCCPCVYISPGKCSKCVCVSTFNSCKKGNVVVHYCVSCTNKIAWQNNAHARQLMIPSYLNTGRAEHKTKSFHCNMLVVVWHCLILIIIKG